jgi:predicted ester cyclase
MNSLRRCTQFQYAVKMSETPILDLERTPREPGFRWRSVFIGAVLGAGLAGVLIMRDQGQLLDLRWPTPNGLLLLPAFWVGIAIHEIGHLVAGKCAGIDTAGISIAPFALMKSGSKWVIRINWRMWLSGFFKPLTNTCDIAPYRFAWMIAGGPIASLVLAIVCVIISMQAGDGTWSWVGTLFWASLVLMFLSLVPQSSGLNKSDGARLWQIIRHPDQARRWAAIIAIQSEEANGLLPREWNSTLFSQMLEVGPNASEFLFCQFLAYSRCVDQAQNEDALQHLESLLDASARAGKQLRHALYFEAAWASAMFRRRQAQARTWLARACKLREPESAAPVEAAIAMSEGRYEYAASQWRAAIEFQTRRRQDSGLVRFAKERWAAYESACLEAVHSIPEDLAKLREFAERYTDAWCSQNPASVAAFFSPEGSLQVNDAAPAVGRSAITQVAQSFMTAFPDLQVKMEELVARGDHIEYRWTLKGTNRGPGGIGHPVQIGGFEKWHFADDGLIASSLGQFDAVEYRRQLEQGPLTVPNP